MNNSCFIFCLLLFAISLKSQPPNNRCSEAILILPISGEGNVCARNQDNTGATGEQFGWSGCEFDNAVVWYTFTTGAHINSLLEINLNGAGLNAELSIFTGSCYNFNPVVLCSQGGTVNIILSSNTTYYIAVSSEHNDTGMFDICLNINHQGSCSIDSSIDVVSTSKGSPFTGPFKPDETVKFRYRINQFRIDNVNQGNNCQWLHMMVPVFGKGWEITPGTEPANVTGPNALFRAPWRWYGEGATVYRAVEHPGIKYFFEDEGMKLCSVLEQDCNGVNLGCQNSVPAGWICSSNGPGAAPSFNWGDGAGCGSEVGSWIVEFELTTVKVDDGACIDLELADLDCSVKVFAFTDGETGGWGNPNDCFAPQRLACANDLPAVFNGTVSCCRDRYEINIELIGLPQFECASDSSDLRIFEVLAEGGLGALNYTWSNGMIGNIIETYYDFYSVTVSDERGCFKILEIEPEFTDSIPPVILARDITVFLDETGQVIVPAIMVDNGSFDNCEIEKYELSKEVFACEELGTQTVLFSIEDLKGNVSETEVEIEVIDDMAPDIECPDNIVIRSNNPVINFSNPEIFDNCEVVVLEQLEGLPSGSDFPFGLTVITFVAIDQSGNESTCSFSITRLKTGLNVPYDADEPHDPDIIKDPAPFSGGNPQRKVKSTEIHEIGFYPNPAGNILFINAGSFHGKRTFSIIDLYGRIVLFKEFDMNESHEEGVDISNLSPGIYLIECTFEGLNIYRKLLKL